MYGWLNYLGGMAAGYGVALWNLQGFHAAPGWLLALAFVLCVVSEFFK